MACGMPSGTAKGQTWGGLCPSGFFRLITLMLEMLLKMSLNSSESVSESLKYNIKLTPRVSVLALLYIPHLVTCLQELESNSMRKLFIICM